MLRTKRYPNLTLEGKARTALFARLSFYRLNPDDYLKLLSDQEGKCAICRDYGGMKLHIDHDHNTKKVRGLLCNKCNTSLGGFGDDPLMLQRAIDYLTDHQ